MDYECRPSSASVVVIDRCEVNEDDEDCEDEEGNDESYGDGDIPNGHVSSFLTFHQVMEND